MDEFGKALKQDIEKLLRSVNRLDDRHTEEGIEIGARWAREWLLQKPHLFFDEYKGEFEKLRTENQRLREALEKLFGCPCIGSCKTDKRSADNGITVYCFKCNTISKALASEE